MKEFIDKLIERLEQERKIAYNTYMNYEMNVDLGRSFGAERAIDIVNQLAEEYKGGWIACSERLPELNEELFSDDLLVAFKDSNDFKIAFYDGNKNKWYLRSSAPYIGDVIAWKPLPAPYTEGE